MDAIMIYSLATQVAAILPSSTPSGQGNMTVTYQGRASSPVPIRVVDAAFGIFTQSQSGSGAAIVQNVGLDGSLTLNTPAQSAAPGSVGVIWGTGLGPVAGNEAAGALPGDLGAGATVLAGGKLAKILYQGRSGCCAGLDQISFVIPDGVEGCSAELTVQVGGISSNGTTISVAAAGTPCVESSGPAPVDLNALRSLATIRSGAIAVINQHYIDVPVIAPTGHLDVITGSFLSSTNADFFGPNRFGGFNVGYALGLQSGSCRTGAWSYDLGSVLSVPSPTYLDAGPSLQVDGPTGHLALTRSTTVYTNPSPAHYLPGNYIVSGSGGKDAGPFSITARVPDAVNWTNADVSAIPRNADLTITWTGGKADGSFINISGLSFSDTLGLVGGSFTCLADPTAGKFTVPSGILRQLPASNVGNFVGSLLLVDTLSTINVVTKGVPGLDILTATGGSADIKKVVFQ